MKDEEELDCMCHSVSVCELEPGDVLFGKLEYHSKFHPTHSFVSLIVGKETVELVLDDGTDVPKKKKKRIRITEFWVNVTQNMHVMTCMFDGPRAIFSYDVIRALKCGR